MQLNHNIQLQKYLITMIQVQNWKVLTTAKKSAQFQLEN